MNNAAARPILPSDPEAATYRTDIKGWVSRHGRFYGDRDDSERIARYDGADASECADCKQVCSKGRVRCDRCQHLKDKADWAALPEDLEWDWPLAEFRGDRFFDDQDALTDFLDDHEEIKVDDLMLVTVEWRGLRQIDEEQISDEAPDGYELPKPIAEALGALNQTIREHGQRQFYFAGNKRATVTL